MKGEILTWNRVTLHTVVYLNHSSTSIYMPNFVQVGQNFVDIETSFLRRLTGQPKI